MRLQSGIWHLASGIATRRRRRPVREESSDWSRPRSLVARTCAWRKRPARASPPPRCPGPERRLQGPWCCVAAAAPRPAACGLALSLCLHCSPLRQFIIRRTARRPAHLTSRRRPAAPPAAAAVCCRCPAAASLPPTPASPSASRLAQSALASPGEQHPTPAIDPPAPTIPCGQPIPTGPLSHCPRQTPAGALPCFAPSWVSVLHGSVETAPSFFVSISWQVNVVRQVGCSSPSSQVAQQANRLAVQLRASPAYVHIVGRSIRPLSRRAHAPVFEQSPVARAPPTTQQRVPAGSPFSPPLLGQYT